jgi:hypothetical protein
MKVVVGRMTNFPAEVAENPTLRESTCACLGPWYDLLAYKLGRTTVGVPSRGNPSI